MTAPKLRVPKDPIPLDSAEAVEYWLASGRIGRVRGWRSTLATLSSGPNRQIRSPAAREARAKMRAAARSLRAAFVAADWLAWERAGMEFNLALANLRIAHMAPLALKGKASIDGGAAGGAEGAKTKKAAADEWQISIEPKVERFTGALAAAASRRMRCLYSGENWRRLAFAGISGSAARPRSPAPPRAGETPLALRAPCISPAPTACSPFVSRALYTKFEEGECLTHIGREGRFSIPVTLFAFGVNYLGHVRATKRQ
jgi:hypothetical protein